MHFLIYIPGDVPPTALAEVGLPGLVEDAWPCRIAVGPDGKAGTLFGWQPSKGRRYLEYKPAEQTWVPSVPFDGQPEGAYWAGWNTLSPPTPDDLQRRFPFRALKVVLGDRREWWFPAERELPFDLRLGPERQWSLVPMERFDEFCHTCRVMRELLSIAPEERRDILITELTEFARAGLEMNYRICPEVESAMKLWNSEIWNCKTAEPLILDMIRRAT